VRQPGIVSLHVADTRLPRRTLAPCNIEGKGAAKNEVEAAQWLRKAAEQGVDAAQYNLGMAYPHGRGVKPDAYIAYVLFSLCALQGNGAAADLREFLRQLLPVDSVKRADGVVDRWEAGAPLPVKWPEEKM